MTLSARCLLSLCFLHVFFCFIFKVLYFRKSLNTSNSDCVLNKKRIFAHIIKYIIRDHFYFHIRICGMFLLQWFEYIHWSGGWQGKVFLTMQCNEILMYGITTVDCRPFCAIFSFCNLIFHKYQFCKFLAGSNCSKRAINMLCHLWVAHQIVHSWILPWCDYNRQWLMNV